MFEDLEVWSLFLAAKYHTHTFPPGDSRPAPTLFTPTFPAWYPNRKFGSQSPSCPSGLLSCSLASPRPRHAPQSLFSALLFLSKIKTNAAFLSALNFKGTIVVKQRGGEAGRGPGGATALQQGQLPGADGREPGGGPGTAASFPPSPPRRNS